MMKEPTRIFTVKLFRFLLVLPSFAFIMFACTTTLETMPVSTVTSTTIPDWFDMELTDAQTGKTFTMNDYAGKVVLLETMAIWCPNCVVQATQVKKLREALGNPEDLITVSLDVDIHEDAASLKAYASSYFFDWHFAVAPLGVARALGNLYSAEYLNPPLSPMLIIDRDGNVHQLEYGIKDVEALQKAIEPFLAK
jgi:cytochrome oxidase Cu insertion factor (SCO1/SenC/PrrC family)